MEPDSGDLLLVAAGDRAALDRVVARWKVPVFGVFERTRDAAAAAEATADVFDRLRATASKYDPGTRADAFLHRLITERILRDAASPAPSIPAATLSGSAAARNAFVRAAVASLPDPERAAFLLTRVLGLAAEAAAQALDVPVADVQRQVVQSLALLRAALEPAVKSVPALGPVERHFGADENAANASVPADLDHRLDVRLHAPMAPTLRWRRAAVAGALIGGVIVVAAFVLVSRAERALPPAALAKAAPALKPTEGPVPDIVRVQSAPMTVDTLPASEAEEAHAAALFPIRFLLSADTLVALDPFFPEDLAAEVAGPAAPRPTRPPSPPAPSPQEVGDRISFLRHLSKAERARLVKLDHEYRQRPEEQRVILWGRWEKVKDLPEETMGGLRPLAERVSALAPERRGALATELREGRSLPHEERLRRFRAHAFAKGLTGQEVAAAEALLR